MACTIIEDKMDAEQTVPQASKPGPTSSTVSLQDELLIIIGSGPVAEALLRKRVKENGRALLLITSQDVRRDGDRGGGVKVDQQHRAWRIGGEMSQAAGESAAQAAKLQRAFGCKTTAAFTAGPTILALPEKSECRVMIASDTGAAIGVKVVMNTGQCVCEASGAVIIAGGIASPDGVQVCTDLAGVQLLDLAVHAEDAKAFFTYSMKAMAFACSAYTAVQFLFYYFMTWFEPNRIASSQFPWWRMVLGLHFIAKGAYCGPGLWGVALVGKAATTTYTLAVAACNIIFATVMPVIPVGDWNAGLFPAVCLATVGPQFLTIPLQFWFGVSTGDKEGRVGISWRKHVLWLAASLITTTGTWMALYAVAMLYITFSAVNEVCDVLGNTLLLPGATTALEHAAVEGMGWAYMKLVYKPRQQTQSMKSTTVHGDQKMVLTCTLYMAHGFAEACRLASLFASAVRADISGVSNGYSLAASLVVGFLMNLVKRADLTRPLRRKFLPPRFHGSPTCFSIVRKDAMFGFGYPRFLPIIVIAVVRVMNGDEYPLFTANAPWVMLGAFVLEILEDLAAPYLSRYAGIEASASYQRYEALNPAQIFSVTSNGLDMQQPAMALRSLRKVCFVAVYTFVTVIGAFTYLLLILLLGAGFVHGMCGAPFAKGAGQVLQSLAYQAPLPCY